jgi:hypothetical protein
MVPLEHYSDDIIVAWDADNPATNICLDTALDMACELATREAAAKGQSNDLTAINRTINSIEKKATDLGQIFISATTIRNAAERILDESKPKHAAPAKPRSAAIWSRSVPSSSIIEITNTPNVAPRFLRASSISARTFGTE